MKNLPAQLGIQSYCFRGTKALGDALTRLKACGVATVELSGVHGDFTRDADAIIAQCRAAGVRIASIGVERFTGNIARERLLAEFMRKAGASVIAVDFEPGAGPDVFRAAERVADEFDPRAYFMSLPVEPPKRKEPEADFDARDYFLNGGGGE